MKAQQQSLLFTGLGFAVVLLYCLALLLPDPLWGLHHLAFLPVGWQLAFPVLAFALLALGHWGKLKINLPALPAAVWVSAIAIGCRLLYYQFPFAASIYGDAEVFTERMGERTTQLLPLYWEQLLSLDVSHPKTGNFTVLSGVRLLSYYLDVTHSQAYRVLGAACGFLFALVWLSAVRRHTNGQLRLLAGIAGLAAPFAQLFFGYEEIYAPAILASTAYLLTLLAYLKTRAWWRLALLPVLLFLSLKMHSVFVLLVPSLLVAVALSLPTLHQAAARWLSWKSSLRWFLLPGVALGALAYFFVFKDWNDPRFLGPEVDIYERVFLPMVPPEAPLNRYHLFHPAHFLDYFNMWFQWAPAALLLLLGALIGWRKHIRWNHPAIVITGTTFILFVLVYMAYNPLMSMPFDFDLFTLPTAALLALLLAVASQLNNAQFGSMALGPTLAVGLLALPVFIANHQTEALSLRAESVGRHVFKTYWIRSAGDVMAGINLSSQPAETKIARLTHTVQALEPYANPGNDTEFAILQLELAKLLRSQQNYERALAHHQAARSFDAQLAPNYIGLMECHYFTGRYAQAHDMALELVARSYPSQKQALRIAIDCGMKANRTQAVLQHCLVYTAQWPGDDIEALQKTLNLSHSHP